MIDHYDGFVPPMLEPQPFVPASYPHEYASGQLFHEVPSPQMQHPVPRRPMSPQMLFSASQSWTEPSTSSLFYPESTRSSFSSDTIHHPSMFAPLPESSSTQSIQPETAEPPQPPPSWSMSGSLDPATGIYQTAPEHPRIRTQQACKKCRSRKAKVLVLLIIFCALV